MNATGGIEAYGLIRIVARLGIGMRPAVAAQLEAVRPLVALVADNEFAVIPHIAMLSADDWLDAKHLTKEEKRQWIQK